MQQKLSYTTKRHEQERNTGVPSHQYCWGEAGQEGWMPCVSSRAAQSHESVPADRAAEREGTTCCYRWHWHKKLNVPADS